MSYLMKPVAWAGLIALTLAGELMWSAGPWQEDPSLRRMSLDTGLEVYADTQPWIGDEQKFAAILHSAVWVERTGQTHRLDVEAH